MLSSLARGFRSLRRNPGLVLLVLLSNLAFALVLAAPLAQQLEDDHAHPGAASPMMDGFDHDWWAEWSPRQEGPSRDLTPAILGKGFAFRNVDLLLSGFLPAGLFAPGGGGAVHPVVLGVGALYWLLQVFLTGGLLGVFRAPHGGWTFRGLVHGSDFYFARVLRVSLLALAAAGVVFVLGAPFARWVDGLAAEAVSGRTATALVLGRHGLLLLALVLVHLVSSHAKVLVVREERLSAALAFLGSLGFCARNLAAVLGQALAVGAAGAAVVLLFGFLDARLSVVGWRTQLGALLLFEALVAARIALRLGLLASQVELQQERGR
ncbi:MAG TPA: hypothetical protein VGB87_10395 [Vicinamibacteria bacterium]